MNRVKILFFATLKEKAGTAEMDLDIPENILVSEFKDLLFKKIPQLPQSRANIVVAINKEFAFDQEQIPNGAEIALFPPVSGG
jgi:molybdopterin synthase catalytic subunit